MEDRTQNLLDPIDIRPVSDLEIFSRFITIGMIKPIISGMMQGRADVGWIACRRTD